MKDTRRQQILHNASNIVILIWTIIQIILVIQAGALTPFSDSAYYLHLAEECSVAKAPYPLASHICGEPYIANPGYINLLAAIITIFKSSTAALWANIIMNCLLLAVLRRIARTISGSASVTDIFTIIYCAIPSTSFVVTGFMSDLPCCLLAFSAVALATRKSPLALFAAGTLLMLANYVRPVAALFIASIILYLILNKTRTTGYLAFISSLVATYLIISTFNYQTTGYWWAFSTTAGVNAIMGANDNSDGTYNPTVFLPGNIGDIPDTPPTNVFQKDSIWTRHTADWIKAHPVEFIKLSPLKIYVQFFVDSFHTHFFQEQSYNTIGPDGRMLSAFRRKVFLESVPYYLTLICAGLGFVSMLRTRKRRLALLLILPVMANILLCVATVGAPRYHYPVIPIFVFFAAEFLYSPTLKKLKTYTPAP